MFPFKLLSPFLLLLPAFLAVAAAAPNVRNKPARIAYYVTVTPANHPLLARFLSRIYHADNLYLLDYTPPLRPPPPSKPNVQTRAADPYTPHGVSEVINVLDGMAYFLDREAYLSTSPSFDYFIHCSPDEYPTVNPSLTRLALSFDADRPPPNYFLFTHRSTWPLFSDEIDRLYMDPALSFNATLDLSKGLLRTSLSHPDKPRRVLTLPRSDKHFVVNREFVKHAVDAPLSKRLLLTLADTSHVYEHFFAALAYNSKDPLGRLVKSTSLRCRDEKALEVEAHKLMPDYRPLPPSIDVIKNSSSPCLFTGPFDTGHGTHMFDVIDQELLIPPGTQGKEPGRGFHDRVIDMLKNIEA